jgi:hypothetical protein
VTGLAQWQAEILRLWLSNIGRSANTADIVLFRGLLDTKEEVISAGLRLLLNSAPQYGKLTGSPQGDTCTASSWVQQSFSSLEEHKAAPMNGPNATPLLEGPSTVVNDMQLLGYGQILQPSSIPDNYFLTPSSHMKPGSRVKERQANNAPFGTGIRDHSSALSVYLPSDNTTSNRGQHLRELVNHFISKKATKGCGNIRSHEHQTGKFICSLGCGRRFRTSADTFRHEEIVYPQQFWFCYMCGDMGNPSERHLFTREDKMRQHIKKYNHATVNLNQCRVPNIRTPFPKKCDLCSHHRHRNWKERCKHIIWHCKKGHYATNTNASGTGQAQDHLVTGGDGDDDDDDGDDDDNDEDDKDDLEDENWDATWMDEFTDQGNGEGPSNWKPDHQKEENDRDDEDDLFSTWVRDSPGLWDYPSSVRITSLHPVDSEQTDFRTTMAWIKWMKRHATDGNVSSAFSVELLPVLEDGTPSKLQTYVVKQYSACNHDLYQRELEILSNPHNDSECTNLRGCHGTFEYVDDFEQRQDNMLLENSGIQAESLPFQIMDETHDLARSQLIYSGFDRIQLAILKDTWSSRLWTLQRLLAPCCDCVVSSDQIFGQQNAVRSRIMAIQHLDLIQLDFAREIISTIQEMQCTMHTNQNCWIRTPETPRNAKTIIPDLIARHREELQDRETTRSRTFPLLHDTMRYSSLQDQIPPSKIDVRLSKSSFDVVLTKNQEQKEEVDAHRHASAPLPHGSWVLSSEGYCPWCRHFQDVVLKLDLRKLHRSKGVVCKICCSRRSSIFTWKVVPDNHIDTDSGNNAKRLDRPGRSSTSSRPYPTTKATTREDLLAEIESWTTEERPKDMFWFRGLAGTGKSTVARTVAQTYPKKHLSSNLFFHSPKHYRNKNLGIVNSAESGMRLLRHDHNGRLLIEPPSYPTSLYSIFQHDWYLTGDSMQQEDHTMWAKMAEKSCPGFWALPHTTSSGGEHLVFDSNDTTAWLDFCLHSPYRQLSSHRAFYVRHSVLQGRITKRHGRIQARTQSRWKQSSSGRGPRALHTQACFPFPYLLSCPRHGNTKARLPSWDDVALARMSSY